jgi:anti-sigma regulatory factor (Ser/Thr protein kinase)
MDHVAVITVNNKASEIKTVHERFANFAKRHHIPEDVLQKINIVFDELLSNIVSYAYLDDQGHQIEIEVKLEDNTLTITISDDGVPFNPFSAEAPDTSLPLEERPIGGLGVHFVRNIMDEYRYYRRGDRNVVVLSKRINM